MLWLDAINRCVELCKSEFYLRVDDDMFLHKNAVEYFLYKLKESKKKLGVYECKLWEDWSHKPAGGIKAYNCGVVKKIGFRTNHLGKVDKPFNHDLSKTTYKRIRDLSMVGIHACASIETQKKYRSLWRDLNVKISKKEFEKTFDNKLHFFDKSLNEQVLTLKKIKKLNKKYQTVFYKFLETGLKSSIC